MSDKADGFYVNYSIDGTDYQAGPYSVHDIVEHFRDIKGYARVERARIAFRRELERLLIGAAEPAAEVGKID